MTAAASHPRSCAGCDGTGWQDGPPVPYLAGGGGLPYQGEYSTVVPCTHPWWNEDPAYNWVDPDG